MDRRPGEPVPLDLHFLTDDESRREFARRYWAAFYGPSYTLEFTENVGSLASDYGVTVYEAQSELADIVAVFYGECTICKNPVVVRNRTHLQRKIYSHVCLQCENAAAKKEYEEFEQTQFADQQQPPTSDPFPVAPRPPLIDWHRMKTKILEDNYPKPQAVDPRSLSLVDATYLIAAFRASLSENLMYVEPLSATMKADCDTPVTPRSLFTIDLIKHLSARKIMRAWPGSDHDAFVWDENGIPSQYYVDRVVWQIAPSSASSRALIEEIEFIFHEPDLPAAWKPHVLALWQYIARHECLEFLSHQLSTHNLPFRAGPKTQMVIDDGLRTFSASQLCNLIYRSAKDAAAFYMRKTGEIPPHHAANTVVGRIQKHVERARIEGWDIKRFGRNFECPRSEVSYVLFDSLFKIGDDGFDETPRAIESTMGNAPAT